MFSNLKIKVNFNLNKIQKIILYFHPFSEKPKLDLSLLAGKEIRVRAGEPIKIEIPVKGTPTPLVTWSKDGKDLPPSDRVCFVFNLFN